MATASVDAIIEPNSAASYHFHPADCICTHGMRHRLKCSTTCRSAFAHGMLPFVCISE